MNTTILNYPGFQTLPKGVKQMLLFSEAHFFEQLASHGAKPWENKPEFRRLFDKTVDRGGRRFGLYQPDRVEQAGTRWPSWPGNLAPAAH
jgi:hypothetical protein